VTRLRVGRLGFDSPQWHGSCLFASTTSTPALGPTHWYWGAPHPGVKQVAQPYVVPMLRMPGAIPPLPVRIHGVTLNYVSGTALRSHSELSKVQFVSERQRSGACYVTRFRYKIHSSIFCSFGPFAIRLCAHNTCGVSSQC
jgi:hypothetical protein